MHNEEWLMICNDGDVDVRAMVSIAYVVKLASSMVVRTLYR